MRTGKPRATSLTAIGRPIAPRPTKATEGRAPADGGGGALDFGRSRSARTDPRGSVRAVRVSALGARERLPLSVREGEAGRMLRRFWDCDGEGVTLFFEANLPPQPTATV